MQCPHCQSQNPEGAKFCSNCGTHLAANCRNCGSPLPSGARFCTNCGQPVALAASPQVPPASAQSAQRTEPDPSPGRLQQYIPKELLNKLEAARANRSMAGERRIVTVLFCDIKGSTALAEALDPEEWAEIMNGAFKYLIEPVYRYEGTLARLMGDAILAFFGAPIAHEDDPQRAALAGLEIVEGMRGYREEIKRRYGFDLHVRVGINTGLVVVGEVGSDLRVEYTAMGDAVNLASRMEQTAEPDTVRISGNTYKSISNLFIFKSLGEIEVRGKAEPVPAYEVLAARRGAVPTRGIEGLNSPLVGRVRELSTLRAAAADLTSGLGRIVSIMGEAGLGKSRLVAELRKEVGTSTGSPAWHEGRSLSYQSSTPYAPFSDIFGSIFGLSPDEGDAQRYSKVLAGVEEVMPGQGEVLAPFIGTLLNLRLDDDSHQLVRYLEPPVVRGRIFHAVNSFIAALSSRGPLLLLFEDLHWVDPTSLELLQGLLPLTESTALMVLAIFRPNQHEPSWAFHETASRQHTDRYLPVILQPLDESESRLLVANLLEIEDLPEKVRALILRKAEGNPFFVEEVIRSLLDAGLVVREGDHWRATREIENIAVPDTLQGVITARLDRLDDEAKHVAQTAAVVGREFAYDVLSEVYDTPQAVPSALSTLQQRELLREKSRLPRRAYIFKHVLTQETAYSSLLLSRRREIHRRVAECLEHNEPERAGEIGRHYLEARQEARALPFLLEAAGRAARGGAREEAISAYRQALEVARALDDHAALREAYEGLGKTLEFAMQPVEAIESYRAMLSFAEEHSDVGMQVSALNKMSYAYAFVLGQVAEAETCLTRAEEIARRSGQLSGLAEAITVRCGICMFTADYDGAEKHLAEAADLGRTLEDLNTAAFGLAHRANMLTYLTQFDEAYATAQEGLLVTEQAKNLEHRSELMTYPIPMYHMRMGNLEEALKWAEEGYTLAARIGAAVPSIIGSYVLGFIEEMRGNYDAALRWHTLGLQHARPYSAFLPFTIVLPLGGLGSVCFAISEKMADKAVEYHTEAMGVLSTPMGAPSAATGWADLGFCAYGLGAYQVAYEHFQKGLTVPSSQMYTHRPRLLAGAALAAQALGLTDEARSYIEEAHRFTEEHSFKCFQPLVSLADGKVSAAQGEFDRALDQFRRAESLAQEMSMRPIVWQARLGAAELLAECGRAAEAQALLAGAQGAMEETLGLFQDEGHRKAFAESMAGKVHASVVSGER